MAQLKEGMKAPDFEGVDQNGKTIKLSDFKGKKLVLYFYPKDNTPGCTAEACNLRDNYDEILKKGFAVVGVSMDSRNPIKVLQINTLCHFLLSPILQKRSLMITEYGKKKASTEGHFSVPCEPLSSSTEKEL